MRSAIYAISALLALGPVPTWAACVTDSNNSAYIEQDATILVGKTACYPAAGPNWTNQEYLNGGNIIDYKKGAADPVDPTSQVGTYTISGNTITYQYGGSSNFSYTVWGPTIANGNIYDFCNGSVALPGQVKLLVGQVPCS